MSLKKRDGLSRFRGFCNREEGIALDGCAPPSVAVSTPSSLEVKLCHRVEHLPDHARIPSGGVRVLGPPPLVQFVRVAEERLRGRQFLGFLRPLVCFFFSAMISPLRLP